MEWSTRFLIGTGTGAIIGFIFMLLLLSFFSFQAHNGKVFTCFNESQTIFEIEQTDDFAKWRNGYNFFYNEAGVRVVSKTGEKYFCSENWREK